MIQLRKILKAIGKIYIVAAIISTAANVWSLHGKVDNLTGKPTAGTTTHNTTSVYSRGIGNPSSWNSGS
jgi:hypothetical protein